VPAPVSPAPDKTPDKIAQMFDAIAGRYDFLNHLLSLGIDRRWRARAVRELDLQRGDLVLDLCTGTADLALAACPPKPEPVSIAAATANADRPKPEPKPDSTLNATAAAEAEGLRVIGVDFSAAMLRFGREKLARLREPRVALVRGDAMRIPLPDSSVHAVTIGFGIRNVHRPDVAAREIVRVLKPGGRLAILEFGTPSLPGLRAVYLFYFRRVLPLIGRVISRHSDAYSYLPASVLAFHSPDDFLSLLRDAGFADVKVVPLTFGVVYLFVAQKNAAATNSSRFRD
jgi:demethylmenaquinone methyltransferase/2-methoxy-6-polyprenyl-1,4-benzoquinol methylase